MRTNINYTNEMRVKVKEHAFLARLRRYLAAQNKSLRLAVPSRRKELGRFYIVDTKAGSVEHKVDLTAYGRKHGILKPWEEIE